MASYMFLFTLAMVLFLTDARPYNQGRSGMKNVKNMMNYDILNEIYRLINEQENREQKLRSLNQPPEVVFWTYQLRKFRHHSASTNEHVKRNLKDDDYQSPEPEHAVEYDGDYLELI